MIIEDDKDINDMLRQLLTFNNYKVLSAFSGTEGVLLHDNTISLILLDLMLPGKTGEEVIKELKIKNNVPIIVISAIHDIDKKINLFDLGADDYITKPFEARELLARIRVQLKHKLNSNKNMILKYKDIEMDITNYLVICNNKRVDFTKCEFLLLQSLMEHPNQVLTKSSLFDLVWGIDSLADDNTLNVHISKIRSKLKKCNPDNNYIETIWSIGYRLENKN